MKLDRRDFLHAGCTMLAASLVPSIVDRAEARFPHGSIVSGFNGGKSQIQSQTLLQGGDYPFINVMKTMQAWSNISGGAIVNPDHLDTNGYLKDISDGGISNVLFIPPSKTGSGDTWVMTWNGRGTVNAGLSTGASTTVTSGSFSNLGGAASGRCEFTLPASVDGAISVSITAITSNIDYPNNMQMFLKSEETALNAGQLIGTDFKNLMQTGRAGVLRFLNWQNANFSNVTTWATRKATAFYSYYADEFRGSAYGSGAMYAGATGGTGDTFTLTFGSGAPVDKQTIQVKFDHSATGTAWTLNLNATGAVPIQNAGNLAYGNSSNTAPFIGIIATLVYDADLNSWLMYGGSNANNVGLRNGPPPEILVQVCAKLGMHPYIVIPPLAADPVTDYITQTDIYIQNSAPSWMIPRYETVNENWNNQFFANTYSFQKAAAYWGTGFNGNNHWCGRMASKVGQALAAGRPLAKSGYQVIVGVQSSQFANTSTHNPRMNTPRLSGFVVGSFTNGSANVLATGNSFALNAPVVIVPQTTDGASQMPTNFAIDTVYFVKSTGSTITLSATPGGSAIVAGSAGSDTFSICNAVGSSSLLAYNWVTTVCCTQYVNANATNALSEITTGFNVLTGDSSGVAAYAAANDVPGLAATYVDWYNWANSFGPAIKLCGYEGGWSQDYQNATTNASFAFITNATKANPCVLTVAMSDMGSASVVAGNAFAVGMPVSCSFNASGGMTQLFTTAVNISFNTGTPGQVSWTAHGFSAGQPITFAAKGTGSSGFNWSGNPDMPQISAGVYIKPGLAYFVKTVVDANTFTIAATSGGAALAIAINTGNTVSAQACSVVTAVSGNSVTLNLDASGFSTFTQLTANASSSWAAGATTITMASNPGTVANGWTVYDSTTGFAIGQVNTFSGTTLTLISGALHASSGAADTLIFSTGLAYYGCFIGPNGAAGSVNMVNAIRQASKSASSLQADTVLNYNNFLAAGALAEFPSCFQLAGQDNAWSVWDPDIYASSTPPQWAGIVQFNHT